MVHIKLRILMEARFLVSILSNISFYLHIVWVFHRQTFMTNWWFMQMRFNILRSAVSLWLEFFTIIVQNECYMQLLIIL